MNLTFFHPTIIFVFTKEEAAWAVQYLKNHPSENIKIFAPTIGSQLILRAANVEPFDYFRPEFHFPPNYKIRLTKYIKQTVRLVEHIKKHSSSLAICGIPLFNILSVVLESEVLAILYTFDFYQRIEALLSPKQYFAPADLPRPGYAGTGDPYFTSASLIVNHFAARHKVFFYHTERKTKSIFEKMQWVIDRIFPVRIFFQKIAVFGLRLFERRVFPQKADVLFYSFGYNLDYYYRFYNLLDKKRINFKLLTLTGKQPLESEFLLRKHGVTFFPLDHLQTQRLKKELAEEKRKLEKTIKDFRQKILPNIIPDTIILPVKTALQEKIELLLQTHGTKFIQHTILAKEAIHRYQPKLVMTTHDPSPSATPFVSFAKQKNIETLLLLHGVIGTAFTERHQSNHTACFGPWTKAFLSKTFRMDPSTLHGIGFPYLDSVIQEAADEEKQPIPAFTNRPINLFLLLSQYLPDSFIISKFLDEIFSVLSKNPSPMQLVIRLHRDQQSSEIGSLANYHHLKIQVNPPITLEEIVKRSDLVLSTDTTAIFWPMIFQKPLIYTTPWWGEWYLPLKKYRAAWVPENSREFEEIFYAFKANPKIARKLFSGQQKFLKAYLGTIDGKSSERLLSLIEKLLP